jgi:hypothetical protein
MLLNAAGEPDTAVRDLDRWAAENRPGQDLAQQYKQFGVYRALYTSANLLARDKPTGARMYFAIMQNRKVVRLGEQLLTSTFPSNGFSWRTQKRRFENGDRGDPIWHGGVCANDLSSNFKRFMLANLAMANNYAYFLSEHVQFAKQQNLIGEMERYATYLGKLNIHCLQQDPHSTDEQADLDSTQASFLDTAAAVELALAAREDQRAEKRARLCKALSYARRADELHRAIAPPRETLVPAWVDEKERDGKAAPWQAIAGHQAARTHLDLVDTGLILSQRIERIQAQLSQAGLDC